MAPPDQAAARKSVRWVWLVLLPILPLALFCAIFGPFLIQESIARRLESRGVLIIYAISPAKWYQRWLHPVPGFQHFGVRLAEARLQVGDPQTSHLLPQIMRDIRALRVPIHVELTGSKQFHEDLRQLHSARVTIVITRDHPIPAADMRLLQTLPELNCLVLTGCQLDREAFEVIGELPGIETLFLEGTTITDEDIPALLRLKKLQSLSLSNTQVSDSAKENLLEKFPNLDLTDD